MILDQFGCVLNGDATYKELSRLLSHSEVNSVVFAWTDQAGTQLDILLAYQPVQYGLLQRGMRAETDLFVAVSSFGMFGFELNGQWKAPGYVGDKLNLGGTENDTNIALAELVNGVCKELTK